MDESEVLTPADDRFHIYKGAFKVPFVCGCRSLGEALRRINEGAAMIRTKVRPRIPPVLIEADRARRGPAMCPRRCATPESSPSRWRA